MTDDELRATIERAMLDAIADWSQHNYQLSEEQKRLFGFAFVRGAEFMRLIWASHYQRMS